MQFAEFQKNLEDFRLLQLSTSNVRTLYNMYDFIAGAEGSECSLYTFISFLDVAPTGFIQQVLTLFATGKFDFRTFILSVWNYCTVTSKNMRKYFAFGSLLIYLHRSLMNTLFSNTLLCTDLFVFDLYNIYGKPLAPPEVINMLRDVYGAHKWKTNAFARRYTFKF